jgi:tol-pal system protein YbgF
VILLRLPRLPALLALLVLFAAPSAMAQTPPADMPGDAGGDAAGDGGEAAALVVRLGRLEQALRQANGRIEQLENAQHRLEDQLQKFRQDVEFRLGDKSGAAPPAATSPAPVATASAAPPVAVDSTPAARPRRSDAFDPDAAPNAPGAPKPLGTTAASTPLTKPAPAAGPPLDLGGPATAPVATGPTIVGSGVAMVDQPREQFNNALQTFQSGQYQQAEDGFKAFMAANPGHRLTADAIFYIGESYFQRSQARQAAEQYLKVTTDFSKSGRAPESMVRLGQTLVALGNTEQACATFQELGRRYPTASPSVKRLAQREMAKDRC